MLRYDSARAFAYNITECNTGWTLTWIINYSFFKMFFSSPYLFIGLSTNFHVSDDEVQSRSSWCSRSDLSVDELFGPLNVTGEEDNQHFSVRPAFYFALQILIARKTSTNLFMTQQFVYERYYSASHPLNGLWVTTWSWRWEHGEADIELLFDSAEGHSELNSGELIYSFFHSHCLSHPELHIAGITCNIQLLEPLTSSLHVG